MVVEVCVVVVGGGIYPGDVALEPLRHAGVVVVDVDVVDVVEDVDVGVIACLVPNVLVLRCRTAFPASSTCLSCFSKIERKVCVFLASILTDTRLSDIVERAQERRLRESFNGCSARLRILRLCANSNNENNETVQEWEVRTWRLLNARTRVLAFVDSTEDDEGDRSPCVNRVCSLDSAVRS